VIDDELEPGRLLDRQLGGLRAIEKLGDVFGEAAEARLDMDPVRHDRVAMSSII